MRWSENHTGKRIQPAVALLAAWLVLLSVASGTNAAVIGYWTLDDSTPDTVTASIGPNGTYENFTASQLRQAAVNPLNPSGTSVLFESGSSNDRINLGANGGIVSGQSALTMAMWVKFGSLTQDNTLASIGTFGAGVPLIFWRDEDAGTPKDTIAVLIGDNRATGGNGILNDTNWHHLAFTYQANTTGGLRVYVDGVLAGSAGTSSSAIAVDSNPLVLGNASSGPSSGKQFDGLMDEVAIWDTALPADTLLAMATGNLVGGKSYSQLVGANGYTVSSGTVIFNGGNYYNGTTTISGGTLQVGEGGADGTLGTGDIVNNASLVVNRTGTVTFDQSISGTGSLTKQGTGTLVLSGNNTYTGTTTISTGQLTVAHNNALGTTAGGTVVAGNATLALQGGITIAEAITAIGNSATVGTIRNLSGNNTLSGNITKAGVTRLRSDAGTLTIAGNIGGTNNSIYLSGDGDGRISGDVGTGWNLLKEGSGTWLIDGRIEQLDGAELAVNGGTLVLAGSNTYTPITNVNTGKLLVNGSTAAASAVSVKSGATLGGTGTIGGTTTIQSGGILAPGMSVGTLGLAGDLTFQAGAFFDVEIADINLADMVQMAGGTLNAGNATIRVSLLDDFDPDAFTSWTILAGEGLINGAFTPEVTVLQGDAFLASNKWFEVSYGNSVVLTVVPEPGAGMLLVLALACALLPRRRK
ncbi:MAG: LamG-like jellyroll fold domain-containing protein [Patescibacteria group bacterium]|nr:LamG-like jellyroll fold domain-containing protein [Patescibacteria group bacterium]